MMQSEHASSDLLRILTVDPDAGAHAFYREALGAHGCEVIEASDGREALVKALVRIPALIITELNLPLLDGIALCDILRGDRATASVPVVIATTETKQDILVRAGQVADVVLPKATTSDVLWEECARLLAGSRSLHDRLADFSVKTSEVVAASATVLSIAAELRRTRRPAVKAPQRYTTTTPAQTPPALPCPTCDRPLIYELSYISGMNERNAEQWDYFICVLCGTFQYRQRTRTLRSVGENEEQWLARLRAMRAS